MVDDGKPAPWREARDRLANPEHGRTYWLATVRPDGQPHVMPLIGLWVDDGFYFITGEGTRKGHNLARSPRCVVSGSTTAVPSLDVIVEGRAQRVSSKAKLKRVAAAFGSTLQWPLEVRGRELVGPNAPTAGPPPYSLFEVTPTIVFGLPGLAGMDKDERRHTPTRWRFSRT